MRTIYLVAALALVLAAPALAKDSPRPPKINTAQSQQSPTTKTFGTGEVKKKSDGTWTIKNDPGEYGGIYYSASPHTRNLGKLHYSFTNLADGDVGGGAPRWSIPIDEDDNKTVDNYAFIDVVSCGGTAGVKTVVSTDNSNCKVYYDSEPTPYANWKAFRTAHPGYKLAGDGNPPFIIADDPAGGSYHISKPVFG